MPPAARPPRLHVVLVPGLGDRMRWLVRLQREALRTWQRRGVRTSVFRVGWSADVALDDRVDALLAHVGRIEARGETVVLVGASAGAGPALAAFERHPGLGAVVLVTGKFHDPSAIPAPVLAHNDVFDESLRTVPERVARLGADQRARVLSLRSRFDTVIPDDDPVLPGAVNEEMPVVGHVVAIGFALLFRGRRAVRFARDAVARRDALAATPPAGRAAVRRSAPVRPVEAVRP